MMVARCMSPRLNGGFHESGLPLVVRTTFAAQALGVSLGENRIDDTGRDS